MAILLLDDKKLTVTVRCKIGESFAPDEESKRIGQEIAEIQKIRTELNTRLNKILVDCHEWNRKHDTDYEANVQKSMTNKGNQKSPEQAVSEGGESA